MDTKNLRTRIKKLVGDGMSMEAVADKIGVSLATIYRWQSAKKKVHRLSVAVLRGLEVLEQSHNRKAKVR